MAKLVAVYGCRHGIGSSNLTANLATNLAQQQRRIGLIDTDLQVPALHLLFGLSEAAIANEGNSCFWGAIADAAAYPHQPWIYPQSLNTLPQQKAGVCLLSHSKSLTTVAQQLGKFYGVNTAPRGLHSVATELALDYLLIDTQPNLDEETLTCLTITDILLILVGLEAHDLQRAAVIIEVAQALGVPQVFLVPSCLPSSLPPPSVHTKFQTAFDTEVAGILPFSEDMVGLASNGIFALHYPDHPLTQTVRTIATRLQSAPPLMLTTAKDDTLNALLSMPPSASLQQRSLFHVLELPAGQRRIMTYILRHGSATVSELNQALSLSFVTINAALDSLVEAGWLHPKQQAEETQYQLQTQSEQCFEIGDGDRFRDRD